jgi:hypothetical protein
MRKNEVDRLPEQDTLTYKKIVFVPTVAYTYEGYYWYQ